MLKEVFIGLSAIVSNETNAVVAPIVTYSVASAPYSAPPPERRFTEVDLVDLKMIDFRVEFQEVVLPKFFANREKISRLIPILGDVDALQKYWLIYRFAEDSYDVKWYALWLQHAHESSFSTNKNAFVRGELFGPMQRSVDLYPDIQVEVAARGHEFLARLPQNHPSDWKELLWTASKLDKDARATKNADTKDRFWAIGDAIQRYSLDGEARRLELDTLRGIFG